MNLKKMLGYFFPILLAALLGSAGCSRSTNSEIAVTKEDRDVSHVQIGEFKSQLQRESGLSLPSEAVVINYEKVSGSDLLIRSQILLPKTLFENWISSYQLSLGDFSEEKRYLLGPDTGWWDPHAPSRLPTAQVMFDNGTVLNWAYQDFGADQVKVYLLFHGT